MRVDDCRTLTASCARTQRLSSLICFPCLITVEAVKKLVSLAELFFAVCAAAFFVWALLTIILRVLGL